MMSLDALFEFRGLNDFPFAALVPRTASVGFTLIAHPGGIVKIFIYQARRGGNADQSRMGLSPSSQAQP